MLPHINPTSTAAWNIVKENAERLKKNHLKQLFIEDKERFQKFSYCLNDTVFDLSKNLIDEPSLKALLQLADECKLKDGITALFNGDLINETEQRAVLHTALRNFSGQPVFFAGKNIMEDVLRVQKQMKDFCDKIHSGKVIAGKRSDIL
jgi:glucose-6-phosphate isomerase